MRGENVYLLQDAKRTKKPQLGTATTVVRLYPTVKWGRKVGLPTQDNFSYSCGKREYKYIAALRHAVHIRSSRRNKNTYLQLEYSIVGNSDAQPAENNVMTTNMHFSTVRLSVQSLFKNYEWRNNSKENLIDTPR